MKITFFAFVILFSNILISQSTHLPENIKLNLTVDNETKTLHLYKADARSDNFRVLRYDSNGYSEISPTPEIRTYRGTISENPNATVYASIDDNGIIRAKCFDHQKGHGYLWTKTSDVSNQIAAPQNPNNDIIQTISWPKSGSTSTPNIGLKIPTGTSSEGISYGKLVNLDLAIDVTSKTVSDYGGDLETILAIYELEALLYDAILTRDALIRVKIPAIVIRQNQFYDTPTTPSLSVMSSEWNTPLLKDSGWDMVWASEGYYANGTFSAGAMHHENGHSLGAFHLAYMADIMGGNKPNHGPVTVERVQQRRKELIDSGKFTQGLEYPFPIHPHTHVDVAQTNKNIAVEIDVLANDWDSNGDDLQVFSFTSNTENGGTVSKLENGNLLYTPASDFVGKDIIVYTVEDNSAMRLKTRDVIHLEVVNNDLMVHYTYDDQSSGTLVTDHSGYGIDGNLNGGNFEEYSVPGPLGNAIRVNGRQNENQIENGNWSGILVGNGEIMPVELFSSRQQSPFELDFNKHSGYSDIMNGDYTFATWFRFDDYDSRDWNSWGHYIASKWWHMETRVGWDLQAIDGKLTLHWRIFDGAEPIETLQAPVELEEGAWYHTVAVFDRTLNQARIYLNGDLVATRVDAFKSHGYIFNGRAPLALGGFSSENGYLDDTRVYTRSLSDSEIIDLYKMPGQSPRFLKNSFSQNLEVNLYYKKNLENILWNGGDYNMSFVSENLPTWLSLSNDGMLFGLPTNENIGLHTFNVIAADKQGSTTSIEINLSVDNNGLAADYWYNLSGTSVSTLKEHVSYPINPDFSASIETLDIQSNNENNNYGLRLHGYLTPQNSGNYTFKISSDDESELWISSNQSDTNKSLIASVPGYTNYQDFDKYSQQVSSSIELNAGQMYFIEVLLKQGSGSSHLTVMWKDENNNEEIIPNSVLTRPQQATPSSNVNFDSEVIDLGTTMFGTLFEGDIQNTANSDLGLDVTYTKLDGPSWLKVGQRGILSGIPSEQDVGINSFSIAATDKYGATDESIVSIKISDELLAHWKFNDSSATELVDATENGNNGIISGQVNYVDGQIDGAYEFLNDGGKGVLESSVPLQEEWSISAVLFRRQTPNYSYLVNDFDDNHSIRIEQYNNTEKVGFTKRGIDDWKINYSIPVDEWSHVVITKQNNTVDFFVNNILRGSINYDLQFDILEIGQYFNGILDDLKIYGVHLDDGEISELYNEFINDNIKPVITLLGDNNLTIERGEEYIDEGASASDNLDGDITSNIVTVNPVDTSILGTYTITYNVSDSAGNQALEVLRTVNVVETTPIPNEINRNVNSPIGELSVNFKLESFRSQTPDHFEVIIMENGQSTILNAGNSRTYMGTVSGHNDAYAVGYLSRDGNFNSVITIGRGVQWWFKNETLVRIKGDLSYSDVSFNYPEAMSLAKNYVNEKVYEFGVAYDVDFTAYDEIRLNHSSVLDGSITAEMAAIESVEFTGALLGATYLHNAKLRPFITRVLIRKDTVDSPYGSPPASGYYSSNNLSELRDYWLTQQSDAMVYTHHVALMNKNQTGGVAFAPGRFTTNNFGGENEFFTCYVILRHEMGHTFWMGDYDGGYRDPQNPDNLIALPPEGKTIMNGNRYALFTGSALMDLFLQRDKDISDGRFSEINYSTPLPPRAVLDLETLIAGKTYFIDILSNDFDVNNHSLDIDSVDAYSVDGVPLTIGVFEGKKGVFYTPNGNSTNSFDRFSYKIIDSSGFTAEANVYVKVLKSSPWVFSHTNLDDIKGVRSRSYETSPEVSNTKFYEDDGYIEWLIDAPTADTYDISFTYASTSGNKKLEIVVNSSIEGILTTTTTSSSDSESNLVFVDSPNLTISLQEGINTVKLRGIESGVGNTTMIRSLNLSGEFDSNANSQPPYFTSELITLPDAEVSKYYELEDDLTKYVNDPNSNETFSFEKISGPEWLSISSSGIITGTPSSDDFATSKFEVKVTDSSGLSDNSIIQISVNKLQSTERYEAEDASLNKANIASNSNASQGQVADFNNTDANGGYIEFTIREYQGNQKVELIFGYFNGSSDRPLLLSINGQEVKTISFPSTTGWNTLGLTKKESIELTSGINKIRLTEAGSNGANVDFLEVRNIETPDFIDPQGDSDNDGISNEDEGGLLDPPTDTDGDGYPDYLESNINDYDNDGVPDHLDATIDDTEPPTIYVPPYIEVAAVDANGTPASDPSIVNFLEDVEATDNIDLNVNITHNAPSVFPLGSTLVTFTATDDVGNEIADTSSVLITDQTPPEINIIGESDLYVAINSNYEDQGATATDNVDPGSIDVETSSNVNTQIGGTYSVTYTATDSSNNSSSKTRSVVVQNSSTRPFITLKVVDHYAEEGKETAAIKIIRTVRESIPVTIYFDYSGTADSSDIIDHKSSITLEAGQNAASLIINPKKDLLNEGTETFKVTLLPNSNYNIGNAEATIFIRDDEYKNTGVVAPLDETFKLHSKPGSDHIIYINFLGGTYYRNNNGIAPSHSIGPFDIDNNPTFSDDEKRMIQKIWSAVSEDYLPFNIDVTTELPPEGALTKSNDSDKTWGVSILVGNYFGSYGFAWSGSEFSTTDDYPGYVSINSSSGFYDIETISQAISHETGHTMGLTHHGDDPNNPGDYYDGHDAGGYKWVPIMGTAWTALSQWSKGDFPNANKSTQDDLAIISNTQNGFGYREDDHSNEFSYATSLIKLNDGFDSLFSEGIIERNTDIDWFVFDHVGGDLILSISPEAISPNLDIGSKLYDSNMQLVAQSDRVAKLSAGYSLNLNAGTYYISVEGVGSQQGVGYSDYGSLGKYTILSGYGIIAEYYPNGETGSSSISGTSQFSSLGISNLNAFNLGSSSYAGSWALYWGANSTQQYVSFTVDSPADKNIIFEKLNVSFYSFNSTTLSIRSSKDDFTANIDSKILSSNTHNVVALDLSTINSTDESLEFRLYMDSSSGFQYLTGPNYQHDSLGMGLVVTGRVISGDTQALSIKQKKINLIAYPNPTSSNIIIEGTFSIGKIYDLTGKEIMVTSSKTTDLTALANGVYFLRLFDSSNEILKTIKLIKN